MAVRQLAVQESINPNIIPMIDIMFLILLFLMLAADMGQRELEDVVLPMAQDVKEDKAEGAQRPCVVNVYHRSESDVACASYSMDRKIERVCVDESHWRIGIHGVDYTPEQLHERLGKEADLERKDPNNPNLSERMVQIRADRSALYGYVQKAMNACAEVGIYKVEIGAARPNDGK